MLTHYVDLTVPARIQYEIYGRILMVMHLTAKAGFPVFADWPTWKNEPGGFGPVIRILGEQHAVERCMSFISPLISAGLVSALSETAQVPPDATYRYAYRRSRSADKGSPSHQRRLERRAIARGESPPDSPAAWVQASHKVPMQSRTSGQSFHLYIKRVPADELAGLSPCSYGLGVLIPRFDVRGA